MIVLDVRQTFGICGLDGFLAALFAFVAATGSYLCAEGFFRRDPGWWQRHRVGVLISSGGSFAVVVLVVGALSLGYPSRIVGIALAGERVELRRCRGLALETQRLPVQALAFAHERHVGALPQSSLVVHANGQRLGSVVLDGRWAAPVNMTALERLAPAAYREFRAARR